MREAGLRGVHRAKRVRTTTRSAAAHERRDLVDRDFAATTPNALWESDLTYVPTWAGVAYVCLITDAFSRMIVGWRVAGHMRTGMVLDALEMARWQRGTRLDNLRCHSDAGSQFTSIRYSERLDEIGAQPSIGSVGDAYDNALAESVNALYKTELVRGPNRGPWKTIDSLELATLNWVHWHNTTRLHSYPRRHTTCRVRSSLRCTHQHNRAGTKPSLTVSNKPSAIQSAHIVRVSHLPTCRCPIGVWPLSDKRSPRVWPLSDKRSRLGSAFEQTQPAVRLRSGRSGG